MLRSIDGFMETLDLVSEHLHSGFVRFAGAQDLRELLP